MNYADFWYVLAFFVLLSQIVATAILLSRLLKGAKRRSPLLPQVADPDLMGKVSVVVPTLNEAERISPCLAGLSRQSYELREVIVVDSNSQDGTPDLVVTAQQNDPRFRVMTDDTLPPGWVGRPWALHTGYLNISKHSEWFLGLDADTEPQPGLIASIVRVAEAEGYDMVSLAPQFILQYPGEWCLQPALLMTLLFRFESAGVDASSSSRVMANGQCFLCRRSVLAKLDGYTTAAGSFCDDVTLARNIATAGYKVGFFDGSKTIKVRMYQGAKETWHEWGRSLDLKDAANSSQVWGDLLFLLCVQALPLPMLLLSAWLLYFGNTYPTIVTIFSLNAFLSLLRYGMLIAIAPSYSGSSFFFWLSPFADIPAVLRIFLSSLNKPTKWRGRSYL
ncbi:glycosyltransferase [Waterburya agarophytonicola K14]|uniref:4,4'-diaponeurosporenoate glycosyltransferase n=1 Tax=Waterburya agarophytonicola KI4 TaxID=2874699 RepID=A0A964FEH4_9CYAN|nr:glycosyltransferase family 2 protein [Waterburya agarophytonicola]MCC0176665.1 glycosyltransferase [Waterburya agarophytonicola KI4]